MNNPWLDPLIRAAKAGDDIVARALVRCMAECLERGVVPPAALAAYFAKALRQIASGKLADDALNTDGKTTGKSAIYTRDCEIAREVWKLTHRAENHLRFRSTTKKTGAFETVAEQYFNTKEAADNVERIYKKMKWLVEAEAFDMTLEPGENREGPEVSEADQKALRDRREVNQHIILGQLAETLKKRGIS